MPVWPAEPRYCACRFYGTPTPWHCPCGRWKPSAEALCHGCALAAVSAVPLTLAALDDEWATYWAETA